jgi:hypothetical protein
MDPGINGSYVRTLQLAASWHNQFGYGAIWNQSIAGFSQLLLAGRAATLLTAVLDVAAVGALLGTSWRSRNLDLPFAVAVVVCLLVSPHVLVHDLALLLLPVAVCLRYRSRRSRPLGTILTFGFCAVLLGLHNAFLGHIQLSVVAMAALCLWMVLSGLHTQRSDQGTEAEPAIGQSIAAS